MKDTKQKPPAIAVFYGDEEFQKSKALSRLLDELLPPQVDRGMALCEYDGTKGEEQGGPTLATVMDDLMTMPFLADRRIVVIRDADKFISAYREKLENYLKSPSPTGTLVLTCRALPKNTKLYKAAAASGAVLVECKKLGLAGLTNFVMEQARVRNKHLSKPVAMRLLEVVSADQGLLAGEIEKLCLYAHDRDTITDADIDEMVGLTREEKIFAAMDAAALGNLPKALQLWHQVTSTDKDAVFKAVGGMCYKVRSWLRAHEMLADGMDSLAVARNAGLWRNPSDLPALIRRQPPLRLKRILARIAQLDSQAKVGGRSIDTGIEAVLAVLATPACDGARGVLAWTRESP